MNSPHESETAWLALCYVQDELTSAERLEFEARLADDQSAREAVAEAVELLCAVSLAEQERLVEAAVTETADSDRIVASVAPASRFSYSSRVAIWGGAVLAASVALVMTWQMLSAARSTGSSDVALVWAQQLADLNDDIQQRHELADEYAAELDPQQRIALNVDRDGDDDGLAPSWLLAAIEAARVPVVSNTP